MKWSEAYKHAGPGIWVPTKLIHALGAKGAIFTSQLFYWTGKERSGDGWIYKTKEEWESETGLSRREQDTCVEDLKRKKILETRYDRLDHRLYYRVSEEALDAVMYVDSPGESTKAPFGKGGSRLLPKSENAVRHIDQKIRQENTDKTTKTAVVDSLACAEDSEEDVFDKHVAEFGPFSPSQRQEIKGWIDQDKGYALRQAEIVRSKPRQSAAASYLKALRDDWQPAKKIEKKKKALSPTLPAQDELSFESRKALLAETKAKVAAV